MREQMDSLLAQTVTNFEIVAVDDGSTDQTLIILRDYAARDRRIKVHANGANLGFRKNFERALSLCEGSLIAPCDQDDVWMPDKLEALLQVLGDAAMAYCDSDIIDDRGTSAGRPMSSRCNMVSGTDPAVFVAANSVAGHAMLVRREAVVRALPVPDCFYYDWWIAVVSAASGGVVYLHRQLVQYRLHDTNVTNVLRTRSGEQQRGWRAQRLTEFGFRLDQIARLCNGRDPFLNQLRSLWLRRENQWFSFRLAVFVFRHWKRIYAVSKLRGRFIPSLKFIPGLKLKRLMNPRAYLRSPGSG